MKADKELPPEEKQEMGLMNTISMIAIVGLAIVSAVSIAIHFFIK